MLVLLSPTKTMKTDREPGAQRAYLPFPDKTRTLVKCLQSFSVEELMALMNMSRPLGELTFERFYSWGTSKQACEEAFLAFRGEVFNGIEAWTLTEDELNRAHGCVRILSGLYGVLRPRDVVQPYRLEMGTKLSVAGCKNLYNYWGNDLVEYLSKDLNDADRPIINLASHEYFKAAKTQLLPNPVITPIFKENKNGTYKVVTIYAKRARGLMTRFVIKHNLQDVESLKAFDEEGYYFNPNLSSAQEWVFTRDS